MYFNFETILTIATIFSGIIWLVDSLFFAKKRLQRQGYIQANTGKLHEITMVYGGIKIPGAVMPKVIEYARAFFPILLLVLILRTWFFEPYRIPSGSDKPTLLIGDLIVVNKHVYGWRWPISNETIIENKTPKIGDIVIFRFSAVDPSKDLIKRVVGLPGDQVQYMNKVLYINGVEAKQTGVGEVVDEEGSRKAQMMMKREDLLGVSHLIYQRKEAPDQNFSVMVPADHYFVMGDNRDDSYDSRYWGFVSQRDLKGKASYIWMSWNGLSEGLQHMVRWSRIGTKIQ